MNNTVMKNNSDSPFWIFLLQKIIENEWINYRELAVNDSNDEKLFKYFDTIFKNNFVEIIINKDTKLYRARQVKTSNVQEIGLNDLDVSELNDLYEEFKKINQINGKQIINYPEYLFFVYGMTYPNEEMFNKLKGVYKQLSNMDFIGYKSEGCGIPPKAFRNEYRLSNKDDEYLYLSFDIHTVLSEMRPSISQIYSIAECKVMKELKILNLYDYSVYDMFSQIPYLINKISEPNTDNHSDFYKITQKLSHYIKEQKFDGIAYKSAMNNQGINLLLFNEKNVEFINSKIYKINNVNIQYDKIF